MGPGWPRTTLAWTIHYERQPTTVARKLRFAVPLAALLVILAGCTRHDAAGSPVASPDTSARNPAAELPLEFRRTGGFVGADDRATISTEGVVTVSRRGTSGTSVTLDPARLSDLRRLLADPALVAQDSAPASTAVCVDGYVYRVRTPSWSAVTDDCSHRGRPALDPVIQFLVPLLNGAATPAAAKPSGPDHPASR